MNPQDYVQCETCGKHHHKDYLHPTPGYDCRCMRCGHEWRTKHPGVWPKVCSKCRSGYWDVPRTRPVKERVGVEAEVASKPRRKVRKDRPLNPPSRLVVPGMPVTPRYKDVGLPPSMRPSISPDASSINAATGLEEEN